VGLGTVAVLKEDPEAVILVLPADHVIRPTAEFHRTVRKAARLAVDRDGLVCLGVQPTYPATGFGYIEPMGGLILPGGFRVKRFIEKPELPQAQQLIKKSGIVWNAGIFCWRGQVILAAIRQWLPGLYQGLEAIHRVWGTPEGKRRLSRFYRRLPTISIDVGVLERSRHVWMVPTGFAWDDVGSWNSLAFLHSADSQGNIVLGSHVGEETAGSILVAREGHLIATIGVNDLIVVSSDDATLVCHKAQAQAVRKIVARLAAGRQTRKFL
jgi:mannose-1-phosphate guanylyltransferase